MAKLIATIFIVMTVVTNSLSQLHITGHITDNELPIVGVAVFVKNTTIGTATDNNGYFDFEYKGQLPDTLIVKCVGFEDKEIGIDKNNFNNLSIVLTAESQTVDEVNVVGTHRTTGFESIDARNVISSIGVSGGVESILTSQMGVSTSSELSSQYRVRGGNFDENMIYVNGIEIYRPFLIRSGEQEGLSFVNPDLIESLNFSSGGFNVSYGDKMSSVLDVHYKTPTKTGGSAKVSLLGATTHIEGSALDNKFSYITGIRYKTNKYIFGSLETSGDYDPSFIDIQSLLSYAPISKLRFDILGYYAQNEYRFKPKDRETKFGTMNDAKKLTIYFEGKEKDKYQTCIAAATATYTPNKNTTLSFTASLYQCLEQENYDILGEYWLQQAEASSTKEKTNESEGIGVGGYMQHARNELFEKIQTISLKGVQTIGKHEISIESKLQTEYFNNYVDEWEYRDSAGYIASPTKGTIIFSNIAKGDNILNTKRFNAYIMDNYHILFDNGSLTLNYGIRLSHWTGNGETIISPRTSLRINKGKIAYRISAGLYNQSPLFREMQRTDGTLNNDVESQHSWQIVGGIDYYFGTDTSPFKLTMEAYYKGLSNINPYNIDNVRIRYMADNCAKGYATGVDFKINGELVEDVESWACISIMKTEEDIENDNHGNIPRPTDQRISFSAFIQDYLPNNKSISATLNMYLSSGLPFGAPHSERYKATNRMPGYKRIDLGLYKNFAKQNDGTQKLKNIKSIQLGIEIFNLFNFSNTISYFWVNDVENRQYAVPNYLTSRRFNVKFAIEF